MSILWFPPRIFNLLVGCSSKFHLLDLESKIAEKLWTGSTRRSSAALDGNSQTAAQAMKVFAVPLDCLWWDLWNLSWGSCAAAGPYIWYIGRAWMMLSYGSAHFLLLVVFYLYSKAVWSHAILDEYETWDSTHKDCHLAGWPGCILSLSFWNSRTCGRSPPSAVLAPFGSTFDICIANLCCLIDSLSSNQILIIIKY